MKVHYYGTPDRSLIQWAFNLKARYPWARFLLLVPVALIFAVLGPIAWVLVNLGSLGHLLAFKLGIDSRESWE